MSPVDEGIVRRKLASMTESLRLLDPIAGLDLAAYRSDPYRRKATERLLQQVVEAATDINAHLLVRGGHPAPDDLYSSYLDLGVAGIIDEELARELVPSAGLRNRLVHEYDAIDDAIVLRSVSVALDVMPRYVTAIEAYLRGRGA